MKISDDIQNILVDVNKTHNSGQIEQQQIAKSLLTALSIITKYIAMGKIAQSI